MKKQEIIELNNQIIDDEVLFEIELSEDVDKVEIMGTSEQYPNCTWFSVELKNGSDIDVFVKY